MDQLNTIKINGVEIIESEAIILQRFEKISNMRFHHEYPMVSEKNLVFSEKNKRVIWLRIVDCGLSSLPKAIGDLSSLQFLFLNNNNLTELPGEIGNLTSLEQLHLNNNKLTSLPESIRGLKSLEYLNLSNNLLSELPSSIEELPSLQDLFLEGNKFTEYPKSIGKLKIFEGGRDGYYHQYPSVSWLIPESRATGKILSVLTNDWRDIREIFEKLNVHSSRERIYLIILMKKIEREGKIISKPLDLEAKKYRMWKLNEK